MKRANSYLHGGAVPSLLAALALAAAGCTAPVDDITDPETEEEETPSNNNSQSANNPQSTVGGDGNTFDHMDDLTPGGGKSNEEIMAQRDQEGPLEVRTRLHSCAKLPVVTLGNVLQDFGVDLNANAPNGQPASAGQLYRDGLRTLGVEDYNAMLAEGVIWRSSGATKTLDIFVQAAPTIIQNIASTQHCGVEMFDANDACNPDAVTCLIGRPATQQHISNCSKAVRDATSVDKGKIIAVAAVLSAAHSCE
ncbi:hypothetical protein [Chondromyces crocatus]|uniref:Secreted protein n=1 Tax=Chondromyces crocatus TaxID=52 RepID=A0A0K1EQ90_CHOCO|nr:hypothetical protein [Chondromyces crocatus]AKT43016.1 uncharacterized protein CMC5_072430 [Chondromyces crocatus]